MPPIVIFIFIPPLLMTTSPVVVFFGEIFDAKPGSEVLLCHWSKADTNVRQFRECGHPQCPMYGFG